MRMESARRPTTGCVNVNFRQIGIEHDLYPADGIYSRLEQILVYQGKFRLFRRNGLGRTGRNIFLHRQLLWHTSVKNAKNYTLVH